MGTSVQGSWICYSLLIRGRMETLLILLPELHTWELFVPLKIWWIISSAGSLWSKCQSCTVVVTECSALLLSKCYLPCLGKRNHLPLAMFASTANSFYNSFHLCAVFIPLFIPFILLCSSSQPLVLELHKLLEAVTFPLQNFCTFLFLYVTWMSFPHCYHTAVSPAFY